MTQERYINPYTDFTKVFEQAEIARFTPKELEDYEESVKIYRDLTNVVRTAERKGREEGRAEGEQSKAIAVARYLKAMGMSDADIAKVTGLAPEEVDTL